MQVLITAGQGLRNRTLAILKDIIYTIIKGKQLEQYYQKSNTG